MSQSGREIRAIVVDDSVLMRQLIKQLLESDPEIEVVATAMDPYVAREKIKAYKPDVITLDIEMPRMDGLTFLKNLMRLHPIPTVMISTLTEKGARETMRALELGAFDAIAKPTSDVEKGLEAAAEHIINVVKAAARTLVRAAALNTSSTWSRRLRVPRFTYLLRVRTARTTKNMRPASLTRTVRAANRWLR